MNSKTKTHRFMSSARVHFTKGDTPGEIEIGVMDINSVIATETRNIMLNDLNRIQQSTQVVFRQRVTDPDVEVHDVYIENITYLGMATQKEFNNIPSSGTTSPEKVNQSGSSLLEGVGKN